MPCFKPLHGYHKRGGGFTVDPSSSNQVKLTIPCGQCIGCRTERKTAWATRLVHESRLSASNCFVTLTYDDAHLPIGGGLDKSHVQLFFKRLRKRIAPKRIRFFAVGEYGDEKLRPHYHAIIFGWKPPDAHLFSRGKNPLYTSDLLATAWGKGYVLVGEADPAACRYVSHYVVKKVTGPMAKDAYTRMDEFGELHNVLPEFSLMSRRPGIGYHFAIQYENDYRSGDFTLLGGRKNKVPPYYDKILKARSESELELVKAKRKSKAKLHAANNTPERLEVREYIAKRKLQFNSQRKDIQT